MDQRRSIGTQLPLGAVEPQHYPALTLGDWLAGPHAIDIFAGGIDGLRSAFGPFPIVLKRATASILGFVDLPVRMQPRQRIIADRAQGDDLVAGFQRHGIVDLNGSDFRVVRQIAGTPIVNL